MDPKVRLGRREILVLRERLVLVARRVRRETRVRMAARSLSPALSPLSLIFLRKVPPVRATSLTRTAIFISGVAPGGQTSERFVVLRVSRDLKVTPVKEDRRVTRVTGARLDYPARMERMDQKAPEGLRVSRVSRVSVGLRESLESRESRESRGLRVLVV